MILGITWASIFGNRSCILQVLAMSLEGPGTSQGEPSNLFFGGLRSSVLRVVQSIGLLQDPIFEFMCPNLNPSNT